MSSIRASNSARLKSRIVGFVIRGTFCPFCTTIVSPVRCPFEVRPDERRISTDVAFMVSHLSLHNAQLCHWIAWLLRGIDEALCLMRRYLVNALLQHRGQFSLVEPTNRTGHASFDHKMWTLTALIMTRLRIRLQINTRVFHSLPHRI